jgi:hypothetical protein
MSKSQRIVFSFDDRSYESTEKLIRQGSFPDHSSKDPNDYEEIKVTNPETGETRIIVLPKSSERKCSHCGK